MLVIKNKTGFKTDFDEEMLSELDEICWRIAGVDHYEVIEVEDNVSVKELSNHINCDGDKEWVFYFACVKDMKATAEKLHEIEDNVVIYRGERL